MPELNITLKDRTAIVELNRPDAMNALTEDMKEQMCTIFQEVGKNPLVRAVVLTAVGKTFCASGDVTTMGNFTPASAMDRLKRAHRMVIALSNIEKPVVAAVRGAVAGIGWSMALACDHIIASETAYFSQVFKNVGLAPDGGAVYFLAQNIGIQRAKDLVLTGRRVAAEEAQSLGLLSQVVPDGTLEERAIEVASRLSQGPTIAFACGKKLFKSTFTPGLEAFLDAEAWAQSLALLTDDHREGVAAFLGKRKPSFQGR